MGLARGLGSNEKVEMTLSALRQTGRGPHGAHLRFSPLALFDVGRLEALRGPAFEPRSVVAHVE